MKIRTRFAPSPTGYMHVGGIRTALFAYLVAKQNHGKFILRLEDTDKSREVKGADKHIEDSLKALGLDYDEGPGLGGPFAPYRQSERLDSYKKWAQKLIDADRAYADPYTPEEVQKFREEAQKNKKPFLYRNHRPDVPPKWDGSQPLRFRSDPTYLAHWDNKQKELLEDLVMGELNINEQTTDDVILIKSDGYPTYNFAHIIDDHEMEVSHVIRGQEFLASMPVYLDLYDALGFNRPKFAHLPHILNENGNKKLSKRDGAKDVLEYIDEGYLPDSLVSFIATLGWNDGTEQEIFTREELIKKFDLSKVQKSGAHFDERRLQWINGHFIRDLELDDLFNLAEQYWEKEAKGADDEYKKSVLALVQERMKYLAELGDLTDFFFVDLPMNKELISGNKQLKKLSQSELKDLLSTAIAKLDKSSFTVKDLTDRLNELLKSTNQKPAVLFSLIRIATTQAPASPALADTMAVLGKERSLKRLKSTLNSL